MQWKTQQFGHSLDMMHRQWQLCRDWQRSGMPGGVRLCCEKAGADMVLVEVVCWTEADLIRQDATLHLGRRGKPLLAYSPSEGVVVEYAAV